MRSRSWGSLVHNIKPVSRNVGVLFDSSLNFEPHVNKLAQSGFYQLRTNSKSITFLLKTDHANF